MLCRLCLDIIRDDKEGMSCKDVPEMVEIVKTTLGISMVSSRDFPQTICVKCYQITVEYYAFRMRCVENQKTLKVQLLNGGVMMEERNDPKTDDIEMLDVTSKPQSRELSPRKLKMLHEKHKIKSCRVTLRHLTAKDLTPPRREPGLPVITCVRSIAHVPQDALNDHNYHVKSLEKQQNGVSVVRTYSTPLPPIPQGLSLSVANPEEPPQDAPRLKVLSSAEINSRAPDPVPSSSSEIQLMCVLRVESGRLEFHFTDETNTIVDFWSIAEKHKESILNIFKPTNVYEKLVTAFSRLPTSRNTEKKLRYIFQGTIPFHIRVQE